MGFYGVGPNVAGKLCARLAIHETALIGSLTTSKRTAVDLELSKLVIENDLRRKIQEDIKRLRDMGTYRGRRHAMSLPVRGVSTLLRV